MTTTLLHGDCRDILPTLPPASVQCIITSPPYYGLRDYGTAEWSGGNPECDHRSPTMRSGRNEDRPLLAGSAASNSVQLVLAAQAGVCGKCGATRTDRQIGIERTPWEYVDTLVAVFREAWRVLCDDGTFWLNLGDSYANDTKWGGQTSGKHANRLHGDTGIGRRRHQTGLRSKNLIGVPWRVALALQDDGWILRNDIIWSKPNVMPENIADRCTKSHEYIFLFTKEERYYFDQEAIAEPAVATKNRGGATKRQHLVVQPGALNDGFGERWQPTGTRNKRTVWTIPVASVRDAHHAVFPESLVEPCILAGSKPGDTVLDMFAGSGTVMRVAERYGRDSIGIDLNADYIDLQKKRTDKVQTEMFV